MYFRYSSIVVAPMHCSSPRARAGFIRFAASMAPSAEPAPTSVWISSMKRIMSSDLVTSSIISLSLCSNSPRYLVSETSNPSSSESTLLPFSRTGTLSSTMSCARPSAIAVLPTPGSPMSTGLFLRRRQRICIARCTSSSRPINGSSCPSRAFCVKSTVHFANVSPLPFFFFLSPPPAPTSSRLPFLTSLNTFFGLIPNCPKSFTASESSVCKITHMRVCQETSFPLASWTEALIAITASGPNSTMEPLFPPKRYAPFSTIFPRTFACVTPARCSAACTSSDCIVPASSMCWVPNSDASRSVASVCAAERIRMQSRSNLSKLKAINGG
mmetsp:Transcript_115187/g.199880  ORF Transcript_115187/g.199880 Transcript_115187/m.199880 type:complete len:328 (+) Transcript_115187:1191-2174(+)